MIQSHSRLKHRLVLMIALVLSLGGFSQSTIVNYDFNSGTSYGTLSPSLAGSITCSANSSETFTAGTGISTGTAAFTSNATAGNAVGMTNSSGTDIRYFLFQLGGSDLNVYTSYKLYVQAKAGATGATTLKVSYSTDGSTYTAFGTTQSPAVGSFRECLFDLSSVIALNQQASVYFKITASGASGTGALVIDNFEIQAVRNPTCSPTLSITNTPTLTCSNPSGVITTSTSASGLNYSWSPGTYTVSAPTVSVAAIYTVTARSSTTGCARTLTTSVTSNTAVPTLSITNSPTITCTNTMVTITGTTTTSGATYSWSPGTFTTSAISVSSPNTYTLRVIGSNGCVSTGTVAVTSNTTAPTLSITNSPTITCTNTMVTITGTTTTSGATYSWSPGTFTTSAISVSSPNTYTLRIIGPNGCVSAGTVAVTSNTTAPTLTVAPSTPSITCTNTAVVITNTNTASSPGYTWSPGGANTNSISVSTGGTYTLLVKDGINGCTISRTTVIATNVTTPTVSAGSNQTITITAPTATLTGSGTAGVTYTWSPGSAHTATTTASSGGIYTLAVTNPTNGCINSATVSVVYKFSITASTTDYQNDTVKGSVNLSVGGGTSPYNIAWNGNKFPTSKEVYHGVLAGAPGLVMDSVAFMADVDSIKQQLYYANLEPGIYPVEVYDANNDSLSLTAYIESPAVWTYTTGVSIDTSLIGLKNMGGGYYMYGIGHRIAQTGTYTAGNHFAISGKSMDPASPYYLGFNVPSNSKKIYVGLRQRDSVATSDTTDMYARAMFRFNGNGSFNVIFNDTVIYTGSMSAGDYFSLRNDPQYGQIEFYQNEGFLTERNLSAINTAGGLQAKLILGSSGASIGGIKEISIKVKNDITAMITDATCADPLSGSIAATGYSIYNTIPISYSLYDASNTLLTTIPISTFPNTVTFTGLGPGTYTIRYDYHIQTGGNAHITKTFDVAYQPGWTNLHNVVVSPSDNSLTRSTGTGDAGAFSNNVLNASATATQWLEWSSPLVNSTNAIGLSATDASQSPSSIQYNVWQIQNSWFKLAVLFNASTYISACPYVASDKFRLQKTIVGSNHNIEFRINNILKGQFLSISNVDLYADASVPFGTITHPRLSFNCEQVACDPAHYAVMHKRMDGGYYTTCSGNLYFTVDGDYSTGPLKYTVYNSARSAVSGLSINSSVLANGDNRYVLDVNSLSLGYYVLEVVNQKNEKLTLRFKR